jgi:hypothetical protein
MSDTEQKAVELGDDRKRLLARMRETISVMYPRYAKFFQRKHQRFDFDAKRLNGFDGWFLQWELRENPNSPESYENQQTSGGIVRLGKS